MEYLRCPKCGQTYPKPQVHCNFCAEGLRPGSEGCCAAVFCSAIVLVLVFLLATLLGGGLWTSWFVAVVFAFAVLALVGQMARSLK